VGWGLGSVRVNPYSAAALRKLSLVRADPTISPETRLYSYHQPPRAMRPRLSRTKKCIQHIYRTIHLYIYTSIYLSIHLSISIYRSIYLHLYLFIYIYLYLYCLSIYLCIYRSIYMYIYICQLMYIGPHGQVYRPTPKEENTAMNRHLAQCDHVL